MQELICVFDIETIPDSTALREVFGYEGDDKEVSLKAFEEQAQKSGSSFLPVNFHKVISISAVLCDKFGRFIKVNSIEGESEKEIIEKFISFIDLKKPRLVSFNGRGFDLPMIMVRAMKYNLSCFSYFDKTVNKWENYRSRYDGVFHLDLLDHISDFRAVSGLNLNALCKTLGLPGKYDVSGDEVLELFYESKFDKIDEYCQSDVLNTYWLFLKYELLRGMVTIEDYARYLDELALYLKEKKSDMGYSEVFIKSIEKELGKLI